MLPSLNADRHRRNQVSVYSATKALHRVSPVERELRLDRIETAPVSLPTANNCAAIARPLDLDRKIIRRCLRQDAWQPYERLARTDTLLAHHAEILRERTPQVGYAARVLWQELGKARFRRQLRDVEAIRAAAARG